VPQVAFTSSSWSPPHDEKCQVRCLLRLRDIPGVVAVSIHFNFHCAANKIQFRLFYMSEKAGEGKKPITGFSTNVGSAMNDVPFALAVRKARVNAHGPHHLKKPQVMSLKSLPERDRKARQTQVARALVPQPCFRMKRRLMENQAKKR
jgi:hypothetical protein